MFLFWEMGAAATADLVVEDGGDAVGTGDVD